MRHPRILSKGELRVIRRTIWEQSTQKFLKHRNVLIFDLLCLTGCRIGEALKAHWEDFDHSTKVWLIPARNEKTKREKAFYLRAQRSFWRHLKYYQAAFPERRRTSPYTFPSQKENKAGDGRLPVKTYTQTIYRRANPKSRKGVWEAGTLHDVRVSKLTRAIRAGYDIKTVQQLSQHACIETLSRYYTFAQMEDSQQALIEL